MNIGIDLDDVLSDFISKYTKICNRLHGKPPIGTIPDSWEWNNFDLTKEQHDAVWEKIRETFNFWKKIDPMSGASPKLLRRIVADHKVVFITARVESDGDSVQRQTAAWLDDTFGIEYPTVLASYDKGPLAAALKLDAFIDDRPKNIIEIKQAVPTCQMYLKNSGHNQTWIGDAIRVKDFNEFAKIILGEK